MKKKEHELRLWLIRKLLPDGYTMPRRRPYVPTKSEEHPNKIEKRLHEVVDDPNGTSF